jgi:cytochrome c oxidase subunit 1
VTDRAAGSASPAPAPPPGGEAHRLALLRTWARKPGLYGWLITTDHKALGLRFVVTAFAFFLLGGLLALAMRFQLAAPGRHVLPPDAYRQFFTTHGTNMMFLFAVPIMTGRASTSCR